MYISILLLISFMNKFILFQLKNELQERHVQLHSVGSFEEGFYDYLVSFETIYGFIKEFFRIYLTLCMFNRDKHKFKQYITGFFYITSIMNIYFSIMEEYYTRSGEILYIIITVFVSILNNYIEAICSYFSAFFISKGKGNLVAIIDFVDLITTLFLNIFLKNFFVVSISSLMSVVSSNSIVLIIFLINYEKQVIENKKKFKKTEKIFKNPITNYKHLFNPETLKMIAYVSLSTIIKNMETRNPTNFLLLENETFRDMEKIKIEQYKFINTIPLVFENVLSEVFISAFIFIFFQPDDKKNEDINSQKRGFMNTLIFNYSFIFLISPLISYISSYKYDIKPEDGYLITSTVLWYSILFTFTKLYEFVFISQSINKNFGIEKMVKILLFKICILVLINSVISRFQGTIMFIFMNFILYSVYHYLFFMIFLSNTKNGVEELSAFFDYRIVSFFFFSIVWNTYCGYSN